MRILFPVSILLILICIPAMGQNANEELARLREHLTVPDSTPIKLANSSALPSGQSLKVYIATGLDVGVRGNFIKWMDEWNKKDGKKYGMVELVSDMSQAEIILARYTLREKITDRTETHSTPVPATVYDPATNSVITRPVPRTYSTSYSLVPVYAYVIAQKPSGLEILWRYTDQTTVAETKESGKSLRDDFFRMMKARAKSQKK
jgi:hypothetical protein